LPCGVLCIYALYGDEHGDKTAYGDCEVSEDDRLMYQVVIGVLIFVLFAGVMLIEWEKMKAKKIAEEIIFWKIIPLEVEVSLLKKSFNKETNDLFEKINRLEEQWEKKSP
jgi:hypothetical protein